MKTVLVGVLFAYSGSVLYAWRRFSDRRRQGLPGVANTLHIKLTGAMLLVLAFDGAGYLLAVTSLPDQSSALVSVLEDIFVAVAMLSISVGLVLPGILAHAMVQVSQAATGMAKGAMASFSNALLALGRGDLDAAQARVDVVPVTRALAATRSGRWRKSVNTLQQEIARAAASLDQAREELRQARHDALTGLITRREFERRLDAALVSTRRDPIAYTLLYLDLDYFKVVNDTCGHAAGDELLRQITGLLRAAIRNRDSVARLGGDEFAILLENCPPEPAERIARDLLQTIQAFSFAWEEKVFKIGVSIGLVGFHDGNVGLLELMRAADDACYVAKKKGRNRIHVYQPADSDVAARQGELDWVGRLRRALNDGRFCLYAQEMVAVSAARKGERHQELLVRMIDDDQRLVDPMEFIPVAERYNLMPAVDRLVISHRVRRVRHASSSKRGGVDTHRWAINLSGASLSDDDFLAFVRDAVRRVSASRTRDLLRDHGDRGHRESRQGHASDSRAEGAGLRLLARRFRQRHVLVRLSEALAGRPSEDRRRVRARHRGRSDRPRHGRGDQQSRPCDGNHDHRGVRRDPADARHSARRSASTTRRASPSPARRRTSCRAISLGRPARTA